MRSEGDSKMLLRDERGMALLITVMTVSLLVAVTIQFHKTTWQEFLVAHNYKTGSQLKTITDSGVNIALAVIQEDGAANQFDSLLDSWATLDKEIFRDLFPTGTLQIQVVDLSGHLQLNSLVGKKKDEGEAQEGEELDKEIREILERLLLSGSFPIEDEGEARGIVDALVDWIDEDDRESDNGAESSYYQSLEKPYSCRNGPVRYIEELLLVKGITPQLLFGTKENRGLVEYLTMYGDDGKINLNTAAPLLVKSINSLISDELIETLDEYRNNESNKEGLAQPDWYQSLGGWPGDIVMPEALITTQSVYFKITAIGEFNSLSRRQVVVAERVSEGEINLLGRKTE